MEIKLKDLTEAEIAGLLWIRDAKSTLVSQIPSKTGVDAFGQTVPGLVIFKNLERKGLCFQTEEEPDEDGFAFTESIEFTEEGRQMAKEIV